VNREAGPTAFSPNPGPSGWNDRPVQHLALGSGCSLPRQPVQRFALANQEFGPTRDPGLVTNLASLNALDQCRQGLPGTDGGRRPTNVPKPRLGGRSGGLRADAAPPVKQTEVENRAGDEVDVLTASPELMVVQSPLPWLARAVLHSLRQPPGGRPARRQLS
jgi:hypothetical protein